MKLTIEVDEKTGQVQINSQDPISLPDFLQLTFSAQLGYLKNILSSAEVKDYANIRDDMYDKYNVGAANVLYLFAPDSTLRPDLTEEALRADLEKENRYMRRQVLKATSKNKNKVYPFKKR